MDFDQFSLQFVDGNINTMNVSGSQEERIPIESSNTHHSNVDCHHPGHNTERLSEDSLLKSLVDEVDSLHQHNVFADLFANVDREENDSMQTFVADIDQKRPDCHSLLGYVDPVLGDPQNESLEAGLFQASNTIRQPEMYHDRLTGDNTNENSKQIIPSGYRMDSDIQENLVGPSEQPMISGVHKQLDGFTVVQQQLLTEEALIKQIVQESAIEEALSTLMGTENVDPVVRGKSKAFPCPKCGKQFSRKQHLNLHSMIHTDARPFKCGQCGDAFRQNSNLTVHQRRHSGEKPFKCQICNAAFSEKKRLSQHMLIHTNKYPFVCPTCNRAFKRRCYLLRHMHIHEGKKPHKCDVCGKAFLSSGNLSKHKDIHSGKSYKCNECEKVFKRKEYLSQHMLIHRGRPPCEGIGKSTPEKMSSRLLEDV